MVDYFGDWTPVAPEQTDLRARVMPAKVAANVNTGSLIEGAVGRIADGTLSSNDNPALVSFDYDAWPSDVHDPPGVAYVGDGGLQFYSQRGRTLAGRDITQEVRLPRPIAAHPAVRGGLPPDVIGVQYDGPSVKAVGAWTIHLTFEAALVGGGAFPQSAQFDIRMGDNVWAGHQQSGSREYFGYADANLPNVASFSPVITGSVTTLGAVVADTDILIPAGQSVASLWMRLNSLNVSPTDPTYETTQWRLDVTDMTFDGQVEWADYRYQYATPRGGMWTQRQRQTAGGNAGGWPSRQRQNGGHTGAWSARQRQTGI